jgi:hypothetical protein
MFPPEGIVKGAARWLHLLRTSTVAQAMRIIAADSQYTDLTQTQYNTSLDWIESLQMLEFGEGRVRLAQRIRALPEEQLRELLLLRSLEHESPAWLRDADVLVPDEAALPQDALELAGALGVREEAVFRSVKRLYGNVDIKERERVGRAGEEALVSLLETCWPGSTTHVSLIDDSFGYDILFRSGDWEWHIEVKTTIRRGRLVVYLSRNEHEVSVKDPHWRLVVAGIDEQSRLQAIANLPAPLLARRAPHDVLPQSRWDSVSHDLRAGDLEAGLAFLPPLGGVTTVATAALIQSGGLQRRDFAWMP